MSITMENAPRRGGLTGRKVAAILVAFFMTITAVDVIMITSALDSQPGLVTDHAYEKGLAHNEVLAAKARQDALGWRVAVERTGGAVMLSIVDSAGAGVAADRVELRLLRPSDANQDRVLVPEAIEAGRFRAEIGAVTPGLWQLAVTIRRGDDRFDSLKTLVIE
ncbi:FixH family protein [Zavarzinia compransoris]|uniref:FixH family protein n=1 Tax=Zavarzinia marina TaxID=2911065 RepID=UPI001F17497F|nr:FixH family protein [Zavarzinia marina]MCF4165687.1 FixH family protein [Zavarzinia marina]